MRVQVSIAFLLGIIATLLAVMVFTPQQPLVQAQTSGQTSGLTAVTGASDAGARNNIWLVDQSTDTPRLAMYEWDGNRMTLHTVRNIRYDMQLDQWPTQDRAHRPTVREIFRQVNE